MRVNQIELAEDRNKYTVMIAVPKHQEKKMQSKKAVFFNLSMNSFNMVIAIGLALVLSVSTIQAAPADSADSADTTSVTTILPETNLTATSPSSTPVPVETTTEQRICHYKTPCGWAVYTPFTRRIEFFMRNVCVCPSDKQCEHADDNLSVGAYVYRCADKPPGQTPKSIDIPEV